MPVAAVPASHAIWSKVTPPAAVPQPPVRIWLDSCLNTWERVDSVCGNFTEEQRTRTSYQSATSWFFCPIHGFSYFYDSSSATTYWAKYANAIKKYPWKILIVIQCYNCKVNIIIIFKSNKTDNVTWVVHLMMRNLFIMFPFKMTENCSAWTMISSPAVLCCPPVVNICN